MPVSFIPSGGEQSGGRQNTTARKRRRRQNVEIDELGDLLPFDLVQRKTLDKLSILRLTTSYMKLQSFMSEAYGANGEQSNSILTNMIDQAMDGFILVLANDATILYASDKMESFLDLNPRDVIGHSLHDLVESEADSETINENLKPKGTQLNQRRLFYIRLRNAVIPGRVKLSRYSTNMMLQVSGNLKVVLDHALNITFGKLVPELAGDPDMGEEMVPQKPHALGLIVECRPIESSPSILELSVSQTSFTSTVGLDMKIQSVDTRVKEILGFDAKDFIGSTFKDYFHPMDHAKMLPCSDLLKRTGYACSPVFRFMTASGEWTWVQLEGTFRYKKETREPVHLDVVVKIISQNEGTLKYIEQQEFYSHGKTEECTALVHCDPYNSLIPKKPIPQTHESLVTGLKDANVSNAVIDAFLHSRELGLSQLPELATDVVSGEEEAVKLEARNQALFQKIDPEKLRGLDPGYIVRHLKDFVKEDSEDGDNVPPSEVTSPPQSVFSSPSPSLSSVSQTSSIPASAAPTPPSLSGFDSHISSPHSASTAIPSPQSTLSTVPSPHSVPPSSYSQDSNSLDSGIDSPTSAGSIPTPNSLESVSAHAPATQPPYASVQIPFQQASQVPYTHNSMQPFSQSSVPNSVAFQPQSTIPKSFHFGTTQQQQQQQSFTQQHPNNSMSASTSDDTLEMLLTDLASPPSQQQQQTYQQQQQQQAVSREWLEKQQRLQDQIQQQQKLLQDLLIQQQSLQMQQQQATFDQLPVHNGSVSSLTPTPSPLSSVGVSPHPVQYSPPNPIHSTNVNQSGQSRTTDNTTNLSFISSVDLLSHSADNTSPSALDLQELWQQLQQ